MFRRKSVLIKEKYEIVTSDPNPISYLSEFSNYMSDHTRPEKNTISHLLFIDNPFVFNILNAAPI